MAPTDFYTVLDEKLQLLYGLHDDSSSEKREMICDYVHENDTISVFAYGSLLWNPIKPVDETICNCTLDGYSKGFICKDLVYRGNIRLPGLTMGLRKDSNSYVNGALLTANADNIAPFIQAFVERESPTIVDGRNMDIYQYDFVEIITSDGIQRALTCIVNEKSSFYLNPQLTLNQQAHKMARAYGQNGTNLQYLKKLLKTYDDCGLKDSCTDELKALHDKIITYRQNLPLDEKKWLEDYDKLPTSDERQKAAASPPSLLAQSTIAS